MLRCGPVDVSTSFSLSRIHSFELLKSNSSTHSQYRFAETHNLNARSLLPLVDAVALRKADGKLCIFSKASAANKNKQSLKV